MQFDNYSTDEFGTIYQVNRQPFVYDETYVTNYNKLDCHKMSVLRYTFLLENVLKVWPTGLKDATLLDVGYANGSFLDVCNESGLKTYGIDIAPLEPPESSTRVYDFAGHYNVITFFDSLEHFPDISFVKNLTADFIMVSLPWCRSGAAFSQDWFLNQYRHRKPDEHLWHFNHRSLTKFMFDAGYIPVEVSNPEDAIRKSTDGFPNILSGVFVKIQPLEDIKRFDTLSAS